MTGPKKGHIRPRSTVERRQLTQVPCHVFATTTPCSPPFLRPSWALLPTGRPRRAVAVCLLVASDCWTRLLASRAMCGPHYTPTFDYSDLEN